MREFKIAVAGSRKAGKWKNTSTSWSDLRGRLTATIYTSETWEEYQAMDTDQRNDAKDKGAFVGGSLRNGRRKTADVECRSLITLDGDHLEAGFIERFKKEFRYAAVLYTTHSHSPEKPRARIVIGLAEDIPSDRYAAVSRFLAAELGIEQFDPVSFRVNQLMHWPSTCKNAEFVSAVTDGPFLDADAYLTGHPGWEDYSNLPVSSREKPLKTPDGKKQEDPLTKKGAVGAFCRAYTPQAAIEKFLRGIYAPSVMEGRYDYIPGEGSSGVVVYEDRFVYSHHATDPAGGKLMNAFDLVRTHLFPNDDETVSFRGMCAFAEEDDLVKAELEKERIAEAQADFEKVTSSWEEPIPFGRYDLEPFPVDALPGDIGDYVRALAESTQTPVDMAGTSALVFISACTQKKYIIQGKADWFEPNNIFGNVIAPPSERKSAVLHGIVRPGDQYELRYNLENAGRVESSKMQRRILEKRQKAIEDKVAKGNAEDGELETIAQQIADFREVKPMQLYVDDITTEKLVSVMGSNNGRAALISSEGGIFDTLAGIYTRNVNIDVMLKGYSGDTIRVDRIGRESESIMNPSLAILLMTQPKVVSDVLGNQTFRGRGLTARFLYCLPTSSVGERRFQSTPIPDAVYQRYEQKIINLLEEEQYPQPHVITLSPEASALLTAFAEELEPKMKTDYAEIADWVGKLVGNTLRIAGLLCRADVYLASDFLGDSEENLIISAGTMANAIRLGRYFLSHALAVFDVIPEATMHKDASRILEMIRERNLSQFDRRMAMRNCRYFKTVADIQPVLDFLDDYGYISRLPEKVFTGGRPPLPKYVVNPAVLS